jgi:hypothetical protein
MIAANALNPRLTNSLSFYFIIGTRPPDPVPDVTPPEIQISTPADGGNIPVEGTAPINVTASDASGISKIEIRFDDVLIETCEEKEFCNTRTPELEKLDYGEHKIEVTAWDSSTSHHQATKTTHVTKGDRGGNSILDSVVESVESVAKSVVESVQSVAESVTEFVK